MQVTVLTLAVQLLLLTAWAFDGPWAGVLPWGVEAVC